MALYTLYGVGAALAIVVIVRQFAREPPTTMTKAYQEQSNEYLKVSQAPTLPSFLFPPRPPVVSLLLAFVWGVFGGESGLMGGACV